MIGVFVDPYPDELFYSICARICKRASYSSDRSAMQDLFGSREVIASVALPSHLDDLIARLPPECSYTSEYLIAEHTLLPFYQPFLPPERSLRLRQNMCGRKGASLYMLSGITASPIPQPQWLRFCPQCVREDKSRYGQCYWHRIHQVSGIEICPFHQVYLQDSDARARNQKRKQEFITAEDAIRWTEQQPRAQSPYHQVLLALARDVDFLLRQHYPPQEPTLLRHRYWKLLFERGLATYTGNVKGDLLLQQFTNCYPPQLLQLLHCEIHEQSRSTWLHRLVQAPKNAQHPLYHLLLIHFLGYTIEDFFALSVENKPFGDGPWPCLNPVCEKSRQFCIRECQIVQSKSVRGRLIGTFACTCGFVYSRTGPDATRKSQFQRDEIKAFGPLWEAKLQLLWKDETANVQAIARQLGVSHNTVKRQAVRIGLPFPRPVGRNDRDFTSDFDDQRSSQNEETYSSAIPLYLQPKGPKISKLLRDPAILEARRAKWLDMVQTHPGAGISLLRHKEPGLYNWLSRNDKMWLSAHTPLPKKQMKPPVRVNWEARDLQLAEEVRRAALLLKDLPGYPICLTISSIGREIGQPAFLHYKLDKLPRTAEVLREFVETREAYAVRRVWWAVAAFSQERIYPARWQLIKRAGVSRLATSPEVKSALDTAMQILQRECKV